MERELGPVFRVQPGLERFDFVKVAEDRVIVVIVWSDGEAAAGAAVIRPALFATHLIPVLASPQDRSVGPALVAVT